MRRHFYTAKKVSDIPISDIPAGDENVANLFLRCSWRKGAKGHDLDCD
jgi:hypothetical protein